MAATVTGSTRWPYLELSIDAQRRAQLMVHDLAHEITDGKWLLTGGGYELVQVVPRIVGLTCSPWPRASRSILSCRCRTPGGR